MGHNEDNDGDGYTPAEGDCDDTEATIYPGATEVCGDGIDQDCNGSDLQCPASIPTNGLIAYYPFDGDTLDMSGYELHGTKTDTVVYTAGKDEIVDTGVSFTDAAAHVSMGNQAEFNSIGNECTIAFWIKVSGSYSGVVIDHDVVGTMSNDWILGVDYGLVHFAYLEPGPSWTGHNDGISNIGDDQWHHVAIQRTQNDGRIRYYIDGVLDLETYGGTNDLTASTGLNVGAYDVSGWVSGFQGTLDELVFYNRILTENEILDLFNSGN
jgi:hypothetical protein